MIVPKPLKRRRQRSIYQQLCTTYPAARLRIYALKKNNLIEIVQSHWYSGCDWTNLGLKYDFEAFKAQRCVNSYLGFVKRVTVRNLFLKRDRRYRSINSMLDL